MHVFFYNGNDLEKRSQEDDSVDMLLWKFCLNADYLKPGEYVKKETSSAHGMLKY